MPPPSRPAGRPAPGSRPPRKPATGPLPVDPPNVLRLSSRFYIAAGAMNAVVGLTGLLALGRLQTEVDRAMTQPGFAGSPRSAVEAATVGTILGIVAVALAWSVAVILLALRLPRGRDRVRVLLVLLAVASLLGVFGLGVLTSALAVIGLVLSVLPASNQYFRERRGPAPRFPRAVLRTIGRLIGPRR